MDFLLDIWIDILVLAIPLICSGFKKLYFHFWGHKNRELSVEYIDGRSYTYKKNNKVEIKVIYNKRQVCNALVALRLSIRNTGKEDISKSSFADPIKFAFDDKYEILDVTKSQQYEKIRPFIQFTSSQIYISWSLLKHSNSFEIDIIAQKKSGVGMIDSAVDFYNGMSYDLNIVGVDELLIEKKITRAERILKKSRAKICFFAIYFVMFAFMAFASKNRPDNEYELILQNDTTLVETAVFVYAEDSVVKIEEFDKKMSIEDFNNEYQIRGVSHKIFDISLIFYVVYLIVAILSFLMVILLVINYIKKRAKLKEDLGSI